MKVYVTRVKRVDPIQHRLTIPLSGPIRIDLVFLTRYVDFEDTLQSDSIGNELVHTCNWR